MAQYSFEQVRKVEEALARFLGVKVNLEQKRGTAIDFISPSGDTSEVKFDWASSKTGNHYLELETSYDFKKTWAPSGFTLAKAQSVFWIVVNKTHIYVLTTKNLNAHIETKKYVSRETSTMSNGNSSNLYARGFLVPLKHLETISTFILEIQNINSNLLEGSEKKVANDT